MQHSDICTEPRLRLLDQFRMLAEIDLSGLSKLAGFDRLQLEPLGPKLRFDIALGIVTGER